MLSEIFYFILNMSLASCFIIAALLLLRLYKPLPRRFIYPLWSLAFFRLIVPVAPATSWSLFNFTGGLVKRLVTVNILAHGSSTPDRLLFMNMLGTAESYMPIEYKTESLRQIFVTRSVVWSIVAAAALLTAFILYALTCRELKKAIFIRNNIYCSDMLLSPLLMGVFRPKIIFPPGLDPDSTEAAMILAHENVHSKRFDNLWRTIAIVTACVHWFNPLVWIMLKAYFNDMELSCDETVIRKNGYSAKELRTYAHTLLHFAEDKKFLISSAFGRSGVKVRIINVLNYKRMTVIGAAVSAVFLLVVTIVLITNPILRR